MKLGVKKVPGIVKTYFNPQETSWIKDLRSPLKGGHFLLRCA